ncbi:Ig-like domain-containing protein [Mycobacterium sp. ITM-2016-00318]|uniref:Ig-like domain-containing protein n=1 Tax=Mycobacterium sp. ITM-2016-00318 TaxID=2099693 RepID=UPI0013049305|nr:cadherin-like domain-containing protein [Mycobacterium sp. ITM-2016-00318]WNG91081.1 cadherin-like domain-containing protein [Mycobacterium sp. ITM-2016-00318]
MGYAKYVGRVGALAFALGLGATVATSTPGIAFAEETEPDPNIGTNQPNETQPDPTPNPDPDPTPPPAGEQLPSGENNQQQINNDNVQTTPSGTEVRSAEPGAVLNTGGYQQEEQQKEQKPVEPTGTTPPPPPPPPVVYVPPTPPVVTPKDQVNQQTVIDEKGKSKDAQLQEESGNKLKTTPSPELSQNNVEAGNGAQLGVTSVDENADDLNSNGVMTMFSTSEDDNDTMQTMAAAAAPATPTPTLTSIFTGFLALVGLGPSTGAGTPSFPFVPTPIFDAIFAFVRRIEATFSNETPSAKLTNPEYQQNGDMSGIIEVEDDYGDGHTYVVSQQGTKGVATVDAEGNVTYTRYANAPAGADTFVITVSDDTGFHIHSSGTQHTSTVTVTTTAPIPAPNPSTGVTSGQIPNTTGQPVSFEVAGDDPDAEMFAVNEQGQWTFTPTPEFRHEAANEENPITEKTYTVDVLDAQGNVIDTVEVTVPVSSTNEVPEFVPPGSNAPPPEISDTGVITGQFQITDGDFDELDIEGESEYGLVEITGQDTDADGVTTVFYKVTPFDQVPQTAGFAPMTMMALDEPESEDFGAMRMMAFEEPAPEDFGAMQTMAFDEPEPASFAALAAPPIIINFTIRDGYGGVTPLQVTVPVDENGNPTGTTVFTSPDPETGEIEFTVIASDPDGDPVTIEVSDPPKGTLTRVGTTNTWVYAPDPGARHAAAAQGATLAERTDGFTITVTDGAGGSVSVPVTVSVAPPLDADSASVVPVSETGAHAAYAIHPDGTRVYLVDSGGFAETNPGVVKVIDTSTNEVVDTIDVGDRPINVVMSKDGSRLYVVNQGSGDVTVINTVDNSVVGTVDIGDNTDPSGLALSQDGKTLYVAHTTTDQTGKQGHIAVVDTDLVGTASDPVVRTIDTGNHAIRALSLLENEDGSTLYGAGVLADSPGTFDKVSVIDVETGDITQPITDSVGDVIGSGVVVSPDGEHVYISDVFRGDLVVVNTANNTVDRRIHVGDFALTPTLNEDGTRALVLTGTGATVVNLTTDDVNQINTGDLALARADFVPGGSGAYALGGTGVGTTYLAYIGGNNANTAPSIQVTEVSTDSTTGAVTYQVTNGGTADPDGDTVTFTGFAPSGTIVDNEDGTFTYTPNNEAIENGDTIIFFANDGHGGITPAPSINYQAPTLNEAPVVDVDYDTDPDTGEVTITVNGSDPDGGDVTYAVTADPTKGTLDQTGANTWVYTPNADARHAAAAQGATEAQRTATLNVAVTDDEGATVTEQINVNVAPPLDPEAATVGQISSTAPHTAVLVSPDNRFVYTVDMINQDGTQNGHVNVIDTTTNQVVDTIEVGKGANSAVLSKDGTRLYVTNATDGTVSVIDTNIDTADPTDGAVVDTITVADPVDPATVITNPWGIAVSPDGKNVYVSYTAENSAGDPQGYIGVIDTDQGELDRTIELGNRQVRGGLAVSADNSTLYATGVGPVDDFQAPLGAPLVIDLATGGVDDQAIDIDHALGVAVSPDGERLYITSYDPDGVNPAELVVLSTADYSEIHRMDVEGGALFAPSLNEDGTRALLNTNSGLKVIDTTTWETTPVSAPPTVFMPIAVFTPGGSGAYAIAIDFTNFDIEKPSYLAYIGGNSANTAPSIEVVEDSTDPATGAVTYQVTNGGNPDPDGDTVTYTGYAADGTIVDNEDGTFTYTPNTGTTEDTITFYANDSHGGITAAPTINYQAPTPVPADGVDATGTAVGPVVINAGKNRAYQLSYDAYTDSTYVTVIDTTTGESVGSDPQPIPGDPAMYGPLQVSPNGEYLVVRAYDSANAKTYVGIFDAEDGHPISGATLDGYAERTMTYHGDRAYQQASFGSYSNNNQKQSVAIFDAETGQALNTVQLDGGQPQLIFDDTNSKAYFSTSNDTFLQETTRLLVLDQVTGTPVTEDPLVFVGRRQGMLVDEQTGDLYVTTTNLSVNPRATNVSTVDVESAEIISETGYFTGEAVGPLLLSADGVHAYQAVQTGYGPYSSEVKVIDLTTGEVEATPLVSSEGRFTQFVRDEDYPIAYLTTYDDNTKQTTIKTVSLESGDVLGTTTMDGNPYGQLTPTAAGGGLTYQATVQTVDNGDGTSTETTRYVFFDRESGLAVGPAVPLNGYKQYEQRVGNQIYVSTYSYSEDTSHVYVIDADNGQLVGSSAVSGYAQDPIVVKNGRGYLVTTEQNSPTVHILIVDMQTGQALGSNGPITIEPPSPDASIHDRPTVQFPAGEEVAYVAVSYDNVDETITTHLISIDTETGELVTDQVFTSDGILVNSSYEPRNYMMYLTLTTADPDTFEMTTVYYEVDSYSGDLVAASTPTPGYGKLVFDGGEQALYLGSREFHIEDFGYSGYTLTPLQGQPGGPVFIPGDVASATVNPDNTLMYVLTNTNDEQSTVTVIDLYSGEVVGDPITISGQAIRDAQFDGNGAGGVVFDDAGNAYITTTTADGGTVITRIAAPDGSGFRMMTLGGESATPPSNLNVIYPQPEDTNPLLVEQFSSSTGDPAQFNMNSLLSV